MVYIDAVHYETDRYGNRYIQKVKWTNSLNQKATDICTKQSMINFINEHPNRTKTKFYRNSTWHEGEDVRVVDNSYLRTDANTIKSDNLGELPEF